MIYRKAHTLQLYIRSICCVALVAAAVVCPSALWAQAIEEGYQIHFRPDVSAIDPEFGANGSTINKLDALLEQIAADPTINVTRISIDGGTSPDGDLRVNNKLAAARAESLYNYVSERCSVADSLVELSSSGITWDMLRAMVLDSDTPHKEEVAAIIDNVPVETWRRLSPTDRWQTLVDSRNKHLMELRIGEPYKYMLANIFPAMRQSSVVVIYFRRTVEPIICHEHAIAAQPLHRTEISPATPAEQTAETPAEQTAESSADSAPKHIAIKTNLLFDAATLVNMELEVPLSQRWSVAAEWVCPWWTNDDGTASSKRNRTQLLNGNLEAKYWFGDRTTRPLMTGWFAGLYAGGGLYDFERDAAGYQGEFFIAAGLSAGYAHTINKSGSLRMEYSLGVGYLETEYRYYEAEYYSGAWHPFRDYTGNYTWIGPTRARVSLVWLIDMGKNKKGGRR